MDTAAAAAAAVVLLTLLLRTVMNNDKKRFTCTPLLRATCLHVHVRRLFRRQLPSTAH